MFYVKTQLNGETNLTLGIHEDNVFTRCPRCKREIAVDLSEVAGDSKGNLYNTTILCVECCLQVHRGDPL